MALTKVSRGLLSTSIVDNGNATAITIDSSENVGIGVTDPSNYYAEHLVVAATDEGGITIVSDPAHQAYLMFADGTSGTAPYRGYVGYDHDSDTMNIVSNGVTRFYSGDPATERMRILSTGGITFNGDTAQANALDDYEEGTWNPTDASGAGLTITVNASSYTKIGNLCYIYAYITYPNTSSTAAQTLGGLPFVTKSSNTYAQLTVRVVDDTVSENNLTFQTTTNSFVGSIHDGTTPIANVDLSGTAILISGVYATA